MPNARRPGKGKARGRREPTFASRLGAAGLVSSVRLLLSEARPFLRRIRRTRRSGPAGRHLRNAAIEVLEAVRDVLDETVEWLREDSRAELKRIRVQQ